MICFGTSFRIMRSSGLALHWTRQKDRKDFRTAANIAVGQDEAERGQPTCPSWYPRHAAQARCQ